MADHDVSANVENLFGGGSPTGTGTGYGTGSGSSTIPSYKDYNIDWDAIIQAQKDKAAAYKKRIKKAIKDNPLQTVDEWLTSTGRSLNNVTGSQAYGDLTSLVNELRAGPTEADYANAMDYAGSFYGQTGDEYTDYNKALTDELSQGVGGQQGFTDEERALRERYNRRNVQEAEATANKMLESVIANYGSTSRYLAAADEAMNSINDTRLKGQLAMADEEFSRQQADWDRKNQLLLERVQSGQISSAEYMNQLQTSKAMAAQGYAQQISTMFAENQEYLGMYRDELNRVNQVIQNEMNSVALEMGVDQNMYESIANEFEIALQPYTLDMQEWALQNEINAQNTEMFLDFFSSILGSAFSAFIPTPKGG